jgi:hypothetical protein
MTSPGVLRADCAVRRACARGRRARCGLWQHASDRDGSAATRMLPAPPRAGQAPKALCTVAQIAWQGRHPHAGVRRHLQGEQGVCAVDDAVRLYVRRQPGRSSSITRSAQMRRGPSRLRPGPTRRALATKHERGFEGQTGTVFTATARRPIRRFINAAMRPRRPGAGIAARTCNPRVRGSPSQPMWSKEHLTSDHAGKRAIAAGVHGVSPCGPDPPGIADGAPPCAAR